MSTLPERRAPNIRSRLLIAGLLGAIVFLSWETVIRTWDLYRTAPIVDLPGHFLSGLATTALAYWFLLWLRTRRGLTGKPHHGAILISLAVALAWEGIEGIQEMIAPDPAYLRDVFFWDGFFDVVAALAGSLVVFPLLRWLRGHSKAFGPIDV